MFRKGLMRYAFGDYVLDTELYRLERQGAGVRLPPRAYQMLVYLLEQRQRVVRRQELFEQVWADQYVSDAALESCIKQVRQAVGDSGRRQHVIQTVHGHGYRFIAEVREVEGLAVATASEVVIPSCDALPASPPASPPLPPPPPSLPLPQPRRYRPRQPRRCPGSPNAVN